MESKNNTLRMAIGLLIVILATTILAQAAQAVSVGTDFAQCANDKTTPNSCEWIGSILQDSNSNYTEGMSVPQRMILTNIPTTAGNVHNLTFSHQATKSGIHAYDFLTAHNQGNDPALVLNPCNDLSTNPAGGLTAVCNDLRNGTHFLDIEVPDDAFTSKDGSTQSRIDAYEGLEGNRFIRIYSNAAISSGTLSLKHDVADSGDTGDSYIEYELIYTSEGDELLVEMGGHLAVSGNTPIAWGPGLGASGISGGPYHFKMAQMDGLSLGSQDNQIKGADIVIHPSVNKTYCGDGIVQTPNDEGTDGPQNDGNEACDGEAPDGYTCTETCELELIIVEEPFCGDNIVNNDEECDGEAGVGEGEYCTEECTLENLPFCGDGEINGPAVLVQPFDGPELFTPEILPAREACDDGNNDNGDGCDEFCQLEDFCPEGFEEILVQAAIYNPDNVEDFSQGLRKDGSAVLAARSTPEQGFVFEVGRDETYFVSLGLGGELIVSFDNPIINWLGDDVQIVEDTWGGPYPPETVEVYASMNGTDWVLLGVGNNEDQNIDHTLTSFDLGSLEYAKYIKIVDTTNPEPHNSKNDGFDLNAIESLQDYIVCEEPKTCGDGEVNQEWEECDGEAGVEDGFYCTEKCELQMTCEYAIAEGLLYGETTNGHATVYNDADQEFLVGYASYKMFAATINDQVLFDADTETVGPDSSVELDIKTPECAHQKDLVCGEIIESGAPLYGDRVIDFHFENQGDWCDQEESGEEVVLSIKEGFPQENNYVFECDASFEADFYNWYYGDGHILLETTEDNTYHTYLETGPYTVACSAWNDEDWGTDTLDIEVDWMTCSEAVGKGLVYGELTEEGVAMVYNDHGDQSFDVGLAVYKMFAATIDDQWLFDSDVTTLEPLSSEELSVEVPACGYQIDVVCGDVLETSPWYGDLVLDFDFGNQGEWCAQEPRGSEVEISVADFYPQDSSYVFDCEASFDADFYNWYFGDGHILLGVTDSSVYHTYTANGDYPVACTAYNGDESGTDVLGINVDFFKNPELSVQVMDEYPQGADYVFECIASDWTPTMYDWEFGDGEHNWDLLVSDVYYTYTESGEYEVTCSATDGDLTLDAMLTVNVEVPEGEELGGDEECTENCDEAPKEVQEFFVLATARSGNGDGQNQFMTDEELCDSGFTQFCTEEPEKEEVEEEGSEGGEGEEGAGDESTGDEDSEEEDDKNALTGAATGLLGGAAWMLALFLLLILALFVAGNVLRQKKPLSW